ncbi:MAG: TerB family tellurite resistance protein [Atopobiaceae bacterium]|nr:TerB family tellurite resistance protein [Atopobiaceae bacterium]
MGLFNMSKLREAVAGAADAVQGAAGAVSEAVKEGKAPDIKLPDIKVPDIQLPNVKLPDVLNNGGDAEVLVSLAADEVSSTDALRIYYYLMSADGELHESELERFNDICNEYGMSDATKKEQLSAELNAKLLEHASSISPLVSAMACVDAALYAPSALGEGESPITARLLLWNMLAIAFADDTFDDSERELINHIANRFGVSETILLEMQDCLMTMADIEREERWVKTSNRPYLTIESVVNELEVRKAAVYESIQSLIAL